MKNVLFYATTAFAASATIQKRQASVIIDVISTVSESVSALNDAVSAFSGINQVGDLQASAAAVLSAIQDAQSTVEPLEPLEQTDAINLAQPISDLAELVEASVQNVIDKRSTFDEVQVSSIVLSTLTDLRDASTQLSDTILSKVPEELAPVGQGLAARITTALNNGVDAYSDATGPTDAPTSGPAPTASPTSDDNDDNDDAPETTAPGGSYQTTAPAPTGVYTTATRPTASPIATYPGAAGQNAASGFGAAAMAALAVAAML